MGMRRLKTILHSWRQLTVLLDRENERSWGGGGGGSWNQNENRRTRGGKLSPEEPNVEQTYYLNDPLVVPFTVR